MKLDHFSREADFANKSQSERAILLLYWLWKYQEKKSASIKELVDLIVLAGFSKPHRTRLRKDLAASRETFQKKPGEFALQPSKIATLDSELSNGSVDRISNTGPLSRETESQSNSGVPSGEARTILISHSEKDEPLVKLVRNLLTNGLSIRASDIFATSIPGHGIRGSKDWREELRSTIETVKAVICLATPNFKQSEVCMNELGAAWIKRLPLQALVVPPVTLGNAALLIDVTQEHLITDQARVAELHHFLDRSGVSINYNSSRWNAALVEFVGSVPQAIKASNFETNPAKTLPHSKHLLVIHETDKLSVQLKRLKTPQTLLAAYVLSLLPVKTYRTTSFVKLLQKLAIEADISASTVIALWNRGGKGKTSPKDDFLALPKLPGFFSWNEIYDREKTSRLIRQHMLDNSVEVPHDDLVQRYATTTLK
jgi:hypothetical protein